MQQFTYEATDATGQTIRGTIQAASQGDAAQQLATQGLTVTLLTAVGQGAGAGGSATGPQNQRGPGILERIANRIADFRAAGTHAFGFLGRSGGMGAPPPPAGVAPARTALGRIAQRLATPEGAGLGSALGHGIGESFTRLFPAFRKVAEEAKKLGDSFADIRRKSNWLNERNPSHHSLLGRLNELSRDRLLTGHQRQHAASAAEHLHTTVRRAGQLGHRAGQARRAASQLAQRAAERQRIAREADQRADRLRHRMRGAAQRARSARQTHRSAHAHLQQASGILQRAQQSRQAVDVARQRVASAYQNLQAAQASGNPQQIAAARQQVQQARQQAQQARANFSPQHLQQAGAHFRRAQQRATRAARARRQATQQFGTARNRFQQATTTAGRHRTTANTATQRAASAQRQFVNLRNQARGMGARAQAARNTATAMARSFTSSTMTTGAIMALGKAGGLAGTAIALFAKETIEAVKRLRVFAESVNANNRELGRWNAGIAVAFARLDVNSMRRNIWMGAMTEKTAVELTKSIDRMRNDWVRTDRAGKNISNVFAAFGAKVSGYFGGRSGPFAEMAERVITNDRVQKGADLVGSVIPKIVPILGVFDAFSTVLDRVNKWLDKNGVLPLPGAGKDLELNPAWEDFLGGARRGHMTKEGQAIIGGPGWMVVDPRRRRQGRPHKPPG